ncbi:MAG: tetratricopeptide repeat protein [Marinifilaceae bacterium]
MKKLSLVLTMVFAVSVLFAQKGKVNAAASNLRSGRLDDAKELIDTGISHRKCVEWPKSYYIKGQVYQAIFESPLSDYKKLSKTPLAISYEAYKKALKLDKKKKYSKKIGKQYINLAIAFANSGANKFNEGDIEGAFNDFKTTLEVENAEVFANKTLIDTPIIFYTGLSAFKLKKYKEAIPFYEKALSYNFESAKCYAALANAHKELKNPTKALEYLHKGYELYPDNLFMLGELINYYLAGGEPEKAEQYLDAAIAQEPSNASFHRAKGQLYEKMDRPDSAIEAYEKTLELDPNDYVSIFNIGMIRIKVIEKRQDEVNNIQDNDLYNKEVKKLYERYAEVAPVFERAHKANPSEIIIVETIKQIYFKIRNAKPEYMAKYEVYKAKQEAMEAGK